MAHSARVGALVALAGVTAVVFARLTLRADDPYTAASRAETTGDIVAGMLRTLHKHRHAGGDA